MTFLSGRRTAGAPLTDATLTANPMAQSALAGASAGYSGTGIAGGSMNPLDYAAGGANPVNYAGNANMTNPYAAGGLVPGRRRAKAEESVLHEQQLYERTWRGRTRRGWRVRGRCGWDGRSRRLRRRRSGDGRRYARTHRHPTEPCCWGVSTRHRGGGVPRRCRCKPLCDHGRRVRDAWRGGRAWSHRGNTSDCSRRITCGRYGWLPRRRGRDGSQHCVRRGSGLRGGCGRRLRNGRYVRRCVSGVRRAVWRCHSGPSWKHGPDSRARKT